MVPLKHRIQDESALRTVLEAQSTTLVTEALATLSATFEEYQRARRWVWFGVGVPILFFGLLGGLVGVFGVENLDWLPLLAVPIIIFITIRYVVPAARVVKKFSRQVDGLLFPAAASVVGISGQVVPSVSSSIPPMPAEVAGSPRAVTEWVKEQLAAAHGDAPTLARLKASELITEPFNTTTIETVFSGTVRDTAVTVTELDVQHVTGSGKNRTVRHIFHGYFIECSLAKILAGKTFVSAEHDKTGFGHLSFFNSAIKETILEWNEFEDILHVATTNEVEARYILTPDFMVDLHRWWKGRGENIRLSFIGDRLFILYPDRRVRIGETVKELDETSLIEHLYTIARPLMHVVHLIEDVRL
jgi:hypothetical protein